MATQNPHVLRAIELCDNSQSELARRCGGKVRQGHVWKWLHMDQLTADACLNIERATDGRVSRHEMRPEYFGRPQAEKAPKSRKAAA